MSLSKLCNWCNAPDSNVVGKHYCSECSDNCVKECNRCHRPFPSLRYFENEADSVCKTCKKIYNNQKEKKREEAKRSKKRSFVLDRPVNEETEEQEEDDVTEEREDDEEEQVEEEEEEEEEEYEDVDDVDISRTRKEKGVAVDKRTPLAANHTSARGRRLTPANSKAKRAPQSAAAAATEESVVTHGRKRKAGSKQDTSPDETCKKRRSNPSLTSKQRADAVRELVDRLFTAQNELKLNKQSNISIILHC